MEKRTLSKSQKIILTTFVLVIVFGTIGGLAYWLNNKKRIYIEKAEIEAPHIDMSATAAGSLEKLMVNPGDKVKESTVLAQVGNQIITSDQPGIVVNTINDIGKNFNPGEKVVTMIYPNEMRVVGHIDENKGFDQIQVGQRVIFTVDALGSKEYYGVVDQISEVSNDSSAVFSISDKRATKQFDIKVRFNINEYPELKEGMSAKLWIYKK